MVSDFKELRVYTLSFEAEKMLQDRSKTWPRSEKYALTDQIRRSSRAVCANIAEAWFKRRYPKHLVSKLSDASSEAAETIVWIGFAQEYGYLGGESGSQLENRYRETIGGLVKMIDNADAWCGPSSEVGEPEREFGGVSAQQNS